ncbi:RXT2-like protein [Usnea florida]
MSQTKLSQETRDTIQGMKLAVARYQDSSDSDVPYLQPTNRGNKLKRKVHHIQNTQSGRTTGAKLYKRTIEHAGYRRDILRRNPKRYDEDGEELDESDEDGEADARAAEENPYAEILLENLLLPLTSPAALPDHPSFSVPYLSSTLTDMAQNACEMVQRERKTLNNAKQLLKKLRGDDIWIPCGSLYSKSDEALFSTEHLYNGTSSNVAPRAPRRFDGQERSANVVVNGDRQLENRNRAKPRAEEVNVNGLHENTTEEDSTDPTEAVAYGALRPSPPDEKREAEATITDVMPDLASADAISKAPDGKPETSEDLERSLEDEIVDIVGPEASITDLAESEETLDIRTAFGQDLGDSANKNDNETRASPHSDNPIPSAVDASTNGDTVLATEDVRDEGMEDGMDADEDENENGTKTSPRRMRTRAQAQAATSPATITRSVSSSSSRSTLPAIHPLFIIPPSAIPSRDIGLPPAEAEETRRMLILYVQKQEEVCRGAEKLHEGLLKADRQRKTVLKWCKAEGHVGEMSDGEDWYDREEWGLEEEGLRKGQNDEEDEGVVQGKKTRGRRA